MAYSILVAGTESPVIDFETLRRKASESGWTAENTPESERLRALFSKPGWPGLRVSGLGETQDQLYARVATWMIANEGPSNLSVNPYPSTDFEAQSVKLWVLTNTPFRSGTEITAFITVEQWKQQWVNQQTGPWGYYLQTIPAGTTATTGFPWGTLAMNTILVGAGAAIMWAVFVWKPKKSVKKTGKHKKRGWIHELLGEH